MIPRECDNDDCDDDNGRWVHVEGCEPAFPLTPERTNELLTTEAPEGSLFASMKAAIMKEMNW